ncbi:MAG: hypothetical protein ACTSRI_07410 [Promethearchaeota archaeon]
MEIIQEKRSFLSILSLIFGVVFIFISVMEFIHVGLEEPLIFFFSSPGDAVFETSILDHMAKGLINLLLAALFLYSYFPLKQGTLSGFGFLVGAGIMALAMGGLFIIEWLANVIDIALQSISDPGVWEEFVFTDGIRLEWFLGIASLYILLIWKNKENYLVS